MLKGPMAGMLRQAQELQEKVKQAKAEIEALEVVGEAGGGLVKVTLSGQQAVRQVKIDFATIGDDHEMVEDLCAAATNDALNRLNAISKEKMQQASGGLNIPGLDLSNLKF